MSTPCVTVVIPYFQRQPGVLRKALRSVAAQIACPLPIHVLVVDDASPAAAAAEVAGLRPETAIDVRIIEQPNGGPGAARNTGLSAASPDTKYLAFLDSDDEWSADHLARAVRALDAGFDLYFADHLQLGQQTSAFARARRIQPQDHPAIGAVEEHLHAYQGDLFDQILRGNVIGTSTVVFRWAKFARERFQVEFKTAGEDYLFWMALARQGAATAFSSRSEATYGRGVNVFSGAGWGTEAHLQRLHHEIRFRCAVRNQHPLSAAQRRHVQDDLKRLRQDFARDVLHRIRHGKRFPPGLLREHAKADLPTYLALPVNLSRIVLGR